MKSIHEAIKKITQEKMKEIASFFSFSKPSDKKIISAITSYIGLDKILSNLNIDELKLLECVYKIKEASTYGDLIKKLHFDLAKIRQITDNLSSLLLVYAIKNRQLLNDKLDKVYPISEIFDLLHVTTSEHIINYIKDLIPYLLENDSNTIINSLKDEKIIHILRYLAQSGFICSINDLKNIIPEQSIDKTISFLLEKDIIALFHNIDNSFRTFIIVNKKVAGEAAMLVTVDNLKTNLQVNNKYFFILNLLKTYDIISTFGLFLTKQKEFRKIDKRRITDSIITIKNMHGIEFDKEIVTNFCLYILNIMGGLTIKKDIAHISLNIITKDLEYPGRIVYKILKTIENRPECDPVFASPYDIPDYLYFNIIFTALNSLKETSLKYLEATVLLKSLSKYKHLSIGQILLKRKHEIDNFYNTLNFLCMLGIIEISNGMIKYSEMACELKPIVRGAKPETLDTLNEKSIYINPDFTLIIPVEEINALNLYHLLSHTEITKNDIIIHAKITRDSIVNAYKRGMVKKHFLTTLDLLSKNDVPQNLAFLIKEWSNQIIKLEIFDAILLKCNQPNFIEELLFGELKTGVIKQISNEYALIDKEYIDDIVKFAIKKEAVISLFADSET